MTVLTLEQVDSRELMARAQQGVDGAFEALYAEYSGYVISIAAQCHPGQADDIAQDVWIRVLGSLHRWRDRGSAPNAWLATITRNICHDRARLWYTQHVTAVDALPEPTGADYTDPATLIADRDLLAALLGGISDRQREAMVLHYLRDIPVAQIAARTGQTEGAVKSLLRLGRRAIARQLTDERTPA